MFSHNQIQPDSPQSPRIAILGSGQMGLVCAGILCASRTSSASRSPSPSISRTLSTAEPPSPPTPPDITLWSHSPDEVSSLTQTRRSDRLDHFILPDSVRVTSDLLKAVTDADLVVSAIPVQFIRSVWSKLTPQPTSSGRSISRLPLHTAVVSVAKGIENKTLLRPTQIIAESLSDNPDAPPRPIGVLSGPTIAAELCRGLPATMIAAADQPDFANTIQSLFSTNYLRIYTHDDVLGVELAGATKNVIAIAAGVLDGLSAGYNAKSALLARGLAEITRLGSAMGARTDTFFGLAGVGDLATTCFSPEGRNRSLGEALGKGIPLNDYLKRSSSIVEGVATTQSVMDLARKYRVEMPITAAVHAVLFENVDPIEAIGRLMARPSKPERVR